MNRLQASDVRTRKQLSTAVAAMLAVVDGLILFLAFYWAADRAFVGDRPFNEYLLARLPYLVIFVAIWWATSIDRHLLGRSGYEDLTEYLYAVTKAVANALVVCTVVMALFSDEGVDRDFLLFFGLGGVAAILVFRAVGRLGLWGLRRRGLDRRRVIIVGANERTGRLVEVMRQREHLGYEILGFVEDDIDRAAVLDAFQLPFLGKVRELAKIVQREPVDEVYVSLPIRSYYENIREIAHFCEGQGIVVRLMADLFPLRIATSRLMYVEDIPLLSLSAIPEAQVRLALKRAVDFTASAVLMVLLAPLFLLIALAIKVDSPGPVLFAQERVGQNQRRFRMLKFRSMVENAEALRSELEALNEASGPVFKIRRDPRVTRVGRFLRRSSLDELPQLINVLRGEMSLVGPRPPLASEVEKYSWDQRRRLSVKPGMTGLWQVSGRSDVDFEKWVEMDLTYIDTWSLWKDFVILLKTFRAVVQGKGAA